MDKYFTYEQAKNWATSNCPTNIKNGRDFKRWVKKNRTLIPAQFPYCPDDYYNYRRIKGKPIWNGWNGWPDFLGKNTKRFCFKYKTDDKSIDDRKRHIVLYLEGTDSEIIFQKNYQLLLDFLKTGNKEKIQ